MADFGRLRVVWVRSFAFVGVEGYISGFVAPADLRGGRGLI